VDESAQSAVKSQTDGNIAHREAANAEHQSQSSKENTVGGEPLENLAEDLGQIIHDLVDIEEYARAERPVPRAHRYRYRVNKQHLVTKCPELTGRQILEAAGLVPVDQYRLRLKERHGPPVEIGLDQVVNLRKPGIERFVAQKKEVQDGLGNRRDFALPAEDIAFLDSLGLRWDAIAEAGNLWVVIYGVVLPPGFTESATDVAIQIMPGYPTSQLDMAYFNPPVLRQDGRSIACANTVENLDGRTWQRWSRHRIGATAWVPGEDNLERHFMFMQDWWSREIAP
jgi:hypothetical protein